MMGIFELMSGKFEVYTVSKMLKGKFDQVYATEEYKGVKHIWRQSGLNKRLDKKGDKLQAP
jgi:hypothetical protein